MITNERLLEAVRDLSFAERDSRWQRINYRDMDVEELGSVYESLLELQPVLRAQREVDREFDLGHSGERKSTGSYYTNPGLVQELIKSALDPVIEETLKKSSTPEGKKERLLDLKVCDPACGSGHFLLAAARRIGREVARIDSGDSEPDPAASRHGVRQAIQHCVYGVDLNPLAVDLCKVALWLEAHEPGKPIGFLDHHIRQGNSLVGATAAVMENGIPTDAFKEVTGDDKTVASGVRKRNTQELRGQMSLEWEVTPITAENMTTYFTQMERDDESVATVEEKERLFSEHRRKTSFWRKQIITDLWTAAFFWPLKHDEPQPPTHGTWRRLNKDKDLVDYILAARKDELRHKSEFKTVRKARALSKANSFFHWELEFEDVFGRNDPGFDVILANPPWEQVQPEEQKFFATRGPHISAAAGATRKRLIDKLSESDALLAAEWQGHVRQSEQLSKFLRESKRFPLTSTGKVNTSAVFAELAMNSIKSTGRSGLVLPDSIATNATTAPFFERLMRTGFLRSMYGFRNERFLFPSIHHAYTFGLYTIGEASESDDLTEFCWQAWSIPEMHDEERRIRLSYQDMVLLNPNTKTCPIFGNKRLADITRSIYQAAPVLIREGPPELNPWRVTFRQGLFIMTSDSHLFRTREQLIGYGYHLSDDSRFRGNGETWLPLYEAKLIHQYDHRFATFDGSAKDDKARNTTHAEHQDSGFAVTPRYWVDESEVETAGECSADQHPGWFLGFRDITNAANERTAIFTIVPWAGIGNSQPIMQFDSQINAREVAGLVGNLSSFAFDFPTRQKAGGTHLNFFIVKQLPVLPPETYTDALLEEIASRVLELVYTAHDLAPFARDLGFEGPPFVWDEERRAQLRADLDGIYAHLYGLNRGDFSYILDQFPIVKRNDVKAFGEYRTKRLCLEAWDRWEGEV